MVKGRQDFRAVSLCETNSEIFAVSTFHGESENIEFSIEFSGKDSPVFTSKSSSSGNRSFEYWDEANADFTGFDNSN